MSNEKAQTHRRKEPRRPGKSFGLCKLRSTYFEVQVGTRKRKKKGGETISEPLYEKFWSLHPVGYLMLPLRKKLQAAVKRVLVGDIKKIEFHLDRFPQVNTVMGEIVAQMPKAQRVRFGFSTKEEENTLFVIERAA